MEVLPFNNFTRYTMQIGTAIETVLLSFALADRINILKKEKEFAQALNHALQVLGESSKDQILQKLVLDYPEIGYYALKEAELDRLIPNNNPLKQKKDLEFAARFRTIEKGKKRVWTD